MRYITLCVRHVEEAWLLIVLLYGVLIVMALDIFLLLFWQGLFPFETCLSAKSFVLFRFVFQMTSVAILQRYLKPGVFCFKYKL